MAITEAVRNAMQNILDEQGKTASDIAEISKTTRTTVSNAIKGRIRKPSIETIHEFCCATGYTLEEFFARKEFDDLE